MNEVWLHRRMRWSGGKNHPGRVKSTFKGSQVRKESFFEELEEVWCVWTSELEDEKEEGEWGEMRLEREWSFEGLSKPVTKFRISPGSMRQLLEQSRDKITFALWKFILSYRKWITGRNQRLRNQRGGCCPRLGARQWWPRLGQWQMAMEWTQNTFQRGIFKMSLCSVFFFLNNFSFSNCISRIITLIHLLFGHVGVAKLLDAINRHHHTLNSSCWNEWLRATENITNSYRESCKIKSILWCQISPSIL